MRRLFASLTIGAARGIERALIIERLRAFLRHRLAEVRRARYRARRRSISCWKPAAAAGYDPAAVLV